MNKYKCVFNMVFRELDNFENGCDGGCVQDEVDISIQAETINELLIAVQKYFNVTGESLLLNSCDEIGRLDVQTMTKSKKAIRDSYSKYKTEFENGDCDLYLNCFIGTVKTIPRLVDLQCTPT